MFIAAHKIGTQHARRYGCTRLQEQSHNMEVCRTLLSVDNWLSIINSGLVRACCATGGAGFVHVHHEVRSVCAARIGHRWSPWTVCE